MHSVGAFDAKRHLGRRLCLVEHRGKDITITRHGKPVAILRSAAANRSEKRQAAIAAIKAFRQGKKRLGGAGSIRELIDEGRRF
ncbi:MAG: type II toxin-antitoxin system Phd/YefM family antitoxin [Thermaerobacter sp.]|nr:type II toxin-antitoxin system Phd/YefM family antitoxin [Thermaerobacter sp.]